MKRLPKYPTAKCSTTPGDCPKCECSSWNERYRPACGFISTAHIQWTCSECGYSTDTQTMDGKP